MTEPRKSRPRDPNQLAKLVAAIATGDVDDRPVTADGKDLAAVLLGRRGGLKGGHARAERLSAEERQRIARHAAHARWGKPNDADLVAILEAAEAPPAKVRGPYKKRAPISGLDG